MKRGKFYGVCPQCDHDWREHPGSVGDVGDRVCSECLYEVEHGERAADVPLCETPAATPPTELLPRSDTRGSSSPTGGGSDDSTVADRVHADGRLRRRPE